MNLENTTRYYLIKDLNFSIATNIYKLPGYETETLDSPDIEYYLNNEFFKKIDLKNSIKTGEFFFINTKDKFILFKRKLLFVEPQMYIQIKNNKKIIYINKDYYKIKKLPSFKRLPSYGYTFAGFLHIEFIKRGYSFIHAGAFSIDDNGCLIVGLSETGKSTSISKLLSAYKNEYNLYYLSDDFTIVNKEKVLFFSCGKIPGYIIEQLIENNWLDNRYKKFVKTGIYPIELFPYRFNAKPKLIIILIKDKNEKIEECSKEEAKKFILFSTSEAILHFSANPILLNYLLIDDLNSYDLIERENKILKELLDNVPCFKIYGSRDNFYKNIMKVVLEFL